MAARRPRTVVAATQMSMDAAVQAGDLDATLSAGPMAALLALAGRIDSEAAIRKAYVDLLKSIRSGEIEADSVSLRPPVIDTMSLPTYLRYCESLQLTPAVQTEKKPGRAKKPEEPTRLAGLRGGRTA